MNRLALLLCILLCAACAPERVLRPTPTSILSTPMEMYETPTPRPTPTFTTVLTSTPESVCSVCADVLHVRSGPGKGYNVVGYVYQGEQFRVIDLNGEWLLIESTSITGWVYARWCK